MSIYIYNVDHFHIFIYIHISKCSKLCTSFCCRGHAAETQRPKTVRTQKIIVDSWKDKSWWSKIEAICGSHVGTLSFHHFF